MLAHRIAKFVDGVFDLTVGHFGCSHDLCHGVILYFYVILVLYMLEGYLIAIAERGLVSKPLSAMAKFAK
jgi:hypothetical protein